MARGSSLCNALFQNAPAIQLTQQYSKAVHNSCELKVHKRVKRLLTFAFLCKVNSTLFLVAKDHHRSLPVFTSNNVSTRIRFVTKRHSLFRSSFTRLSIGIVYTLLCLNRFKQKDGLTTFRFSNIRREGAVYAPMVRVSVLRKPQVLNLDRPASRLLV